ncbi:MAG: hypothetical protein JWO37_2270 [Acidimicrobiales bacterium]|jgi:hypothetical protein|nr:hypothetical protein [Acidimicrobiales bacterium]
MPRPCSRRALATMSAAALLLGGVVTTIESAGPATAGGAESSRMLADLQGARASAGLGALAVNGELTAKAQNWADHMAATGSLSHSSPSAGISANWTRLGENVGDGPDPDSIHQAFMASSAHRAHILDPGFQYVGVGSAWRGSTLYVAEEFMQTAGGAPPAPPSRTPTYFTQRASRSSTASPRLVASAPAAAPVLVPAGFDYVAPALLAPKVEAAYQVWLRWFFCQQLQVCAKR